MKKEIRQCVICGDENKKPEPTTNKNKKLLRGEYSVKLTSIVRTCSKECSIKHQKNLHKKSSLDRYYRNKENKK